MTLYLLHFHRAHRVHLASKVVKLLLLNHFAQGEESFDLLEEYLSHCSEYHEAIIACDMHALD